MKCNLEFEIRRIESYSCPMWSLLSKCFRIVLNSFHKSLPLPIDYQQQAYREQLLPRRRMIRWKCVGLVYIYGWLPVYMKNIAWALTLSTLCHYVWFCGKVTSLFNCIYKFCTNSFMLHIIQYILLNVTRGPGQGL